jgi:hypothetical protein
MGDQSFGCLVVQMGNQLTLSSGSTRDPHNEAAVKKPTFMWFLMFNAVEVVARYMNTKGYLAHGYDMVMRSADKEE